HSVIPWYRPERPDSKCQTFLVGEPAPREPRIADAPEPVSRRVDGRVDDIGLSAKEALDSTRDVLAVRDDRLDGGRRSLVLRPPPIDPASGGPAPGPRERSEERIVEIVEHPNRGEAIPDVRAEPRRGEYGPGCGGE